MDIAYIRPERFPQLGCGVRGTGARNKPADGKRGSDGPGELYHSFLLQPKPLALQGREACVPWNRGLSQVACTDEVCAWAGLRKGMIPSAGIKLEYDLYMYDPGDYWTLITAHWISPKADIYRRESHVKAGIRSSSAVGVVGRMGTGMSLMLWSPWACFPDGFVWQG